MQVQKQNIDLDVIVQLNSSSPAASSKRSPTDSSSNPNFATLRVLPLHRSPARRSVSSATRTRHSACLLARRDTRVPLLSQATAAISCFSASVAKQRLLQRTLTGTGEPSSKRHPVHCAKCHTASIPRRTWRLRWQVVMSECPGLMPAWPYLFARTAWCLGLSSFFFFSVCSLFLCAPLGACLLPLHLCLLRHCTLGSSSPSLL